MINHLMYADDICLICPSVKGLQKLIYICEHVGADIDMLFNVKKTMCMYFACHRLRLLDVPQLRMYGSTLEYVSSVNYLGYFITPNLSDDQAMQSQIRSLYARANSLIRGFRHCSVEVKRILFSSYCTSLYCAQLWSDYSMGVISKLRVAYNGALKLLLGVSRQSSTSLLFANNRLDTFDAKLRKLSHSFVSRLLSSENSIIHTLAHSDCFYLSPFWRHYVNLVFLR